MAVYYMNEWHETDRYRVKRGRQRLGAEGIGGGIFKVRRKKVGRIF